VTHDLHVTRTSLGWSAEGRGLPRSVQARRLDRLHELLAELSPTREFPEHEVASAVRTDPAADLALSDYRAASVALALAQTDYNQTLFRAVQLLSAAKVSTRDIGFLTGLSHQRIAQIQAAS
jgi:hypothetical protein